MSTTVLNDCSVWDQVTEILEQDTGIAPDRLTPQTRLADLDIESMDLIQAIFAIEMRFGLEIPHAASLETVGDFMDFIEAHRA